MISYTITDGPRGAEVCPSNTESGHHWGIVLKRGGIWRWNPYCAKCLWCGRREFPRWWHRFTEA